MAMKRIEKRQKNENNSVQAPQPFSDIIDHVCEQDKKYFEENPGRSFYLRRYVPGEFWPLDFNDDTWVRVENIHPGLRMLVPCTMEKADEAKIGEMAREVSFDGGADQIFSR